MMAWYDAALRRLSVPHEAVVVLTRHGDTHVIAAGPSEAPPVVLLHALSANALMWSRQISGLSHAHRIYAPDIIGMAGRSAPSRLAYGGPGYADWLADVLDGLGIARAALVGLAFGGWLVLKFGASPGGAERMTHAVLLNPAGLRPLRWQFMLPILFDLLFLTDDRARRLSRSMLATPGLPLDEHLVDMLYLVLKHFKSQYEAPPLPDSDLRRMTAPSLLLVGQHENVWEPEALVARARNLLPDLRAAEFVPGAGHALTASQPEAVNARLLRFLRETA